MINKELLVQTLETIKANPEHWDRSQWHCGATHCFAGFTYLLSMDLPLTTNQYDLGKDIVMQTKSIASALLGFNELQADTLFHPNNTLEGLEYFVGCYLK